jgi:hypothetical protein
MKKLKLIILITLFPTLIFSQGVELVPFAGYMFGGKIKYIQGDIKLDNGMDYGISILIPTASRVEVELNYTRMESQATFTPNLGYPLLERKQSNVATNYFQIGGLSKFSEGSMATPFGSYSLGATWFHSEDYGDEWRFSIVLGLGVKLMFSDRVGIILRGRLMMPMIFGGAGFGFGTGGAGIYASSFVAPWQGDFHGGLIFKIGG